MSAADDLARASRRLYALGWMRGTSGNVSVRDGAEILVTASGIDKSAVEPEDAVLIDARPTQTFEMPYWSATAP